MVSTTLRQKNNENAFLAAFVIAAVINLLPLASLLFFHQEAGASYLYYLYWVEAAVLTVVAVFIFAKRFAVFFLILTFAAIIISLATPIPYLVGINIHLTFWGLYSLFWVAYIEMRQGHMGHVMERRPPLTQLAFYTAFMIAAITACAWLTMYLNDSADLFSTLPSSLLMVLLSAAVLVPTISMALLKVIDMIGARHFVPLMVGTYYRPAEKDRIVLFLDMAGSAGMAEKLGPLASISLIARFIYDASAIFRLHGGDVVNYTGDGLVVIWPRAQADRVIKAIHALRSRLKASTPFYMKEFSAVPDFRVGVHAGKVIISQLGEEKLFLALYGDTVNTASRLEKMNKETNTKVLLSAALIPHMSQAIQALVQPLGRKYLKGKDEAVEVYTLRKDEN